MRCPVVMMRTSWTLLTKICNVQFVMWLYENRFWPDVATYFVKNAWSDTWRGMLKISFCYLILPHGCKKKKKKKNCAGKWMRKEGLTRQRFSFLSRGVNMDIGLRIITSCSFESCVQFFNHNLRNNQRRFPLKYIENTFSLSRVLFDL